MYDEELDRFKRDIHLVQYAIERYGYTRDKAESSRRSHVLRMAWTDDSLPGRPGYAIGSHPCQTSTGQPRMTHGSSSACMSASYAQPPASRRSTMSRHHAPSPHATHPRC
jgi:hypothetical protein